MVVKARVKTVVEQQFPEYVRNDSPLFISFLQAYFEFLENTNNSVDVIRNLQSIQDIDETIDLYFDHLHNEIMPDIPRILYSTSDGQTINKKLLAKHIKEFYSNRGNEQSYYFLFKILFNEDIELFYPKQKLFFSSSGDWDYQTLIRFKQISGDPFLLLGKTVVQDVTLASARIENIVKIQINDVFIYEALIAKNSINGTFSPENLVRIKGDLNSPVVSIVSVISSFNIEDGGLYYREGDRINVTGYDNTIHQYADITETSSGSIDNIVILNPGTNYIEGQPLVFSATTTNPAVGIISEIQRDSIILENGNKLLLENGSNIINEQASTSGPIKSINLISGGDFYKTLPEITIGPLNSHNGSNAKLLATSNTIGKIVKIEPSIIVDIINDPYRPLYSNLINRFITLGKSGNFIQDETLTILPQKILLENGDYLLLETGDEILKEHQESPIGVFKSYDLNTSTIEIYSSSQNGRILLENNFGLILEENGDRIDLENNGNFEINEIVIGQTSGAIAKLISGRETVSLPEIGQIYKNSGSYLNDFHKLGYDLRIQDSKYWQIFSYVIKSGQSINDYRSLVKKLLHPSGLALFGEIEISNFIYSGERNFFGSVVKRLIELLVENEFGLAESKLELNLETNLTNVNNIAGFGPTLKFLERFKFNFPPYTGGNVYPLMKTNLAWNQTYPQNNSHYWELGNMQIKDVGNIVIGDVIDNYYKKTNICPDIYMTITRTNPPPYFDSETITFDSTIKNMDRD